MKMLHLMIAMLVAAMAVLAAGYSHAETRVALVIGNGAYKHTRALPNPGNDAAAIARRFRAMGFDSVCLKKDLDYQAMRLAIRNFGRRAQRADVAVVYFAGHGLEVGGQNYLIPTDAKLLSDNDLEYEAVTLGSILKQVRSARALRLVILDACRNNPLSSKMQLSQGITRSVTRGFSRIEPEGDIYVAYAARHGTVAADGDGIHSPYTSALLKHMSEPGIDIRRMFGKVRDSVSAATNGRQQPHTYGSLGGGLLYLVPPDGKTGPAARREERREAKRQDPIARPLRPERAPVCNGIATKVRGVERCLKAGQSFRDCDDCPTMVVVPTGSYMMGSPTGEKGRYDHEGPRQRVTISTSFAAGKFEVTFAEWDVCVSDGGCSHKPGDGGWGRGRRPVISVSWDDAKSYLSWLSRKTGRTYRLLSEAEWEYAARAGSTTRFHFGDREKDICAYGNGADRNTSLDWKNKTCSDGVGEKTTEVGRFKSNAFGLHDLNGNVDEWVEDCWNKTYSGRPSDVSPWTNGDCNSRVLRGGSWLNGPWDLRSASRSSYPKGFRYETVGFRVARTLEP